MATNSYIQTAQTPNQTLRSWADSYGVSVGWDAATSTVTLTSPNNTTIKFTANQGDGFGVGKLNEDNNHVVADSDALYNALNLGKASPEPAAAAPVSDSYIAGYKYSREAEALKRKQQDTVDALNAKKSDIEDAYFRKRGELYGQFKDGELAYAERLAAKGLNGGYADSVAGRAGTAYKTSAANLDVVKNDDLKAVDSAIEKAYKSGAEALYDLETNYVSQLLKSAQSLEGINYISQITT